jgi:hypothetical protein
MISFNFPNWEIHNAKDPIGFVVYPSRKMKAYKLRALSGKYFVIKEGRTYEGIFELDPTKAFLFGKTPVYLFDSRNCLPIDATLVNELSKFSKKNNLGKIKEKDRDHGVMLKALTEKIPVLENAIEQLKTILKKRQEKTLKTIEEIGQPEGLTPKETGFIITNNLAGRDLLTPDEKAKLDQDLGLGKMDYTGLISYLKDRDILRVSSPMELNVQMFLDDFGGYNPEQMASFLDRLRRDEKGLKQMTSIPIKSWIPASLVMALLIGGAIAVMILVQNSGALTGILP